MRAGRLIPIIGWTVSIAFAAAPQSPSGPPPPLRLRTLIDAFEQSLATNDITQADIVLEQIRLLVRQLQTEPKSARLWREEMLAVKSTNREAGALEMWRQLFSDIEQRMLQSSGMREPLVGLVAYYAEKAGEVVPANGYAWEAIRFAASDSKYGAVQIFYGNTVLGLLALRKNDIESAKRYLLASAETPGWPGMSKEGPNLKLAHQLLEKSQPEVVLEFLENCRKFWPAGGANISKWQAMIRAGRMPDWGGKELEALPQPTL